MNAPSDNPPADPPDYAALAQRASRPPNQSSLYRWLEAMFDSLGPDLGRVSDWRPICEAAHADGVTGGHGQVPTPRLLASQWRKIRRRRLATTTRQTNQAPNPRTVSPAADSSQARMGTNEPKLFSELACRGPTLSAVTDPENLTAEGKQRRGQAEADRVLGELRAASHRKWGFGRLEGEA